MVALDCWFDCWFGALVYLLVLVFAVFCLCYCLVLSCFLFALFEVIVSLAWLFGCLDSWSLLVCYDYLLWLDCGCCFGFSLC